MFLLFFPPESWEAEIKMAAAGDANLPHANANRLQFKGFSVETDRLFIRSASD